LKSIVISQTGGPQVLELRDTVPAQLGPHDLLVDVAAAGVNFMDIYQRIGQPPYDTSLPIFPGAEGAGTVAALGAEVSEFNLGDRVAWANAPGSYSEQVVVSEDRAVKVPDEIELEVAAAVMLQGMTAHYLCNSTYVVEPHDPLVVHAAAGGVGLLLIQLAKRRGGVVVATTSDDEKASIAQDAGADYTARYEDFAQITREVTTKAGAACVYDGVGAATFEASLSALRPRGYLVLFGAASGPVPPFDLQRLAGFGSLYVTRPHLRDYIATRAELRWRSEEVFSAIEDGSLKVRIGATYPLSEAARAHADLASRATTGKLLLIPA